MATAAAVSAFPSIQFAPATKRLLAVAGWCFVGILWIGLTALVLAAARIGNFGGADFDVYYHAALKFSAGISPYTTVNDQSYFYPPLLAILITPLAQALSVADARAVWIVANVTLILGVLHFLSRITAPRFRWVLWIIPILALSTFESLYIGQITVVLAALFVGVWWAARTKHPLLTGVLLALACWLKVYPAFLLLFFVLRGEWRIVLYTMIIGVLLGIFQALVVSPQRMIESFQFLFALAEAGQPERIALNLSVQGVTAQWFIGNSVITPLFINPPLQSLSRMALTFGLIAMLIGSAVGIRAHTGDKRTFDLQYAAALLVMLLISPTLFHAGLPPLLFAVFLLLTHTGRNRFARYGVAALLILLNIHYLYMLGFSPQAPVFGPAAAFGFYTLLAFAIALFASLLVGRRSPQVQT